MTTSLIAIALLAILFAVFGLLRPRGGCTGACDHCTHGCDFNEDNSNV